MQIDFGVKSLYWHLSFDRILLGGANVREVKSFTHFNEVERERLADNPTEPATDELGINVAHA